MSANGEANFLSEVSALFAAIFAVVVAARKFSKRHPRWAAFLAAMVLGGGGTWATGYDPREILVWANEPLMRPIREDLRLVKKMTIRLPGGDSVFALIQQEERRSLDSLARYGDSVKAAGWKR